MTHIWINTLLTAHLISGSATMSGCRASSSSMAASEPGPSPALVSRHRTSSLDVQMLAHFYISNFNA